MAKPWEEYQTQTPAAAGPILVRSREDVLGGLDRLNAPAAPPAAGPWTEYQEPAGPPKATDEERRSVVGFLGNVAKSTGSLLGGLVNVPEQVKGISALFAGMSEKSGFKPLPGQPDVNAVDALVAHYKDRYGSLEGFKKAMYEDPAGVMFDVATVLEPAGAGLKAAGLPRAAAVTTRVARTINPVAQTVRLGGAAVSRGLPAVDTAMEAAAQRLRQSALRGGYNVNTPHTEVAGAARAMRGMPLTAEALERVTQEERALQTQKMKTLTEAELRGAAVPRSQILQGLEELRGQYQAQPLAGRDVKQIDRAIAEVAETYPEQIPVTKAEAIKEGLTWKEGMPPELQATAGAEKKIAEVIRRDLVEWAPELEELNKSQQSRIWLKNFMEGAINKRLNSAGLLNRVFNIKTIGAGLAGSLVGPGGIASGAVIAGVLADPVIQSHLAVAINKAQQLNPARWGRPNMGTAVARAGKVAQDARIPVERRLAAPAQETIITPPPADTSYVRGVPGMYPTGPNPARALPAPSTIIPPAPPDTSYVRGVPAEYPRVERIVPVERRLAAPAETIVPAEVLPPPVVEVPPLRAAPPVIEIPARPPAAAPAIAAEVPPSRPTLDEFKAGLEVMTNEPVALTAPVSIPFDKIRSNPKSLANAAERARSFEIRPDTPPITVIPDGKGGYFLDDGHHRYTALKRNPPENVAAILRFDPETSFALRDPRNVSAVYKHFFGEEPIPPAAGGAAATMPPETARMSPAEGEAIFQEQKARVEQLQAENEALKQRTTLENLPEATPPHYADVQKREGTANALRAFTKDQRIANYLLSEGITPEAWAAMPLEQQNQLIVRAPAASAKGKHRPYLPRPKGAGAGSVGRWADEGIQHITDTMRWIQEQAPETMPLRQPPAPAAAALPIVVAKMTPAEAEAVFQQQKAKAGKRKKPKASD